MLLPLVVLRAAWCPNFEANIYCSEYMDKANLSLSKMVLIFDSNFPS